MDTKICTKCNAEKPLSEYHKDNNRLDGKRGLCKECDKKQHDSYVENNRDRIREYNRTRYKKKRDGILKLNKKYHKKNRSTALINGARTRAKLKDVEFDLDLHTNEIRARIDNGVCEMSGVKFNLDGGRTFDSPSIDRINPAEGYVYSNIRVVCHLMNCALGTWGEHRLYEVVKEWLKKKEN